MNQAKRNKLTTEQIRRIIDNADINSSNYMVRTCARTMVKQLQDELVRREAEIIERHAR
jgi:hypothetical protein